MDLSIEQKAFLEKHSIRFLQMAFDYQRHEKTYRPDGYGKNVGDCGDTVEVFLTVMKNIIQKVSLSIDGCVYTNACANTVAQLVEGKSVDDAWEISPEQVTEFLETVPPESFHCAELAVGALFLALSDYKRKPFVK